MQCITFNIFCNLFAKINIFAIFIKAFSFWFIYLNSAFWFYWWLCHQTICSDLICNFRCCVRYCHVDKTANKLNI